MLARLVEGVPDVELARGDSDATNKYADDTISFIEGLVEEARNWSILLDLFGDFLGLQINCVKSTF